MLLTYPLMAAIQEISARLGRTTGHGIAGNIRRHYPNWLLQIIVTLLVVANAINIGADLSAMADAAQVSSAARLSLCGGVRRSASTATFSLSTTVTSCPEMADFGLFAYVGRCSRITSMGRRARAFVPRITPERRLLDHLGGDPRHHHLTLSVLLASLTGGGRCEGEPSA